MIKLNSYDLCKVNFFKTVLPILIIIHHIPNNGFPLAGLYGDFSMFVFFAMSGFGLVISYRNRPGYLDNFLLRSLSKLFIPYFISLIIFVLYEIVHGQNIFELFYEKGLLDFVPYLWFVWVLALFYVIFFMIFKYFKFSLLIRSLVVFLFVFIYVLVAPCLEIKEWMYDRCLPFGIGMLFAVLDDKFKRKCNCFEFTLSFAALTLIMIALMKFHANIEIKSIVFSILFFLLMYLIPSFRNFKVIQFLSSISFEMYVIQFLPNFLFVKDLQISSPKIVIPFVILVDIILAYVMHVVVKWIKSK